ncbi:serine hydrolase [Streptomyces sp. DH37]|uniref:serine hydrolase n=1 Tax=Streptomyces sp. DH37 TaxID=3040122 RepID=UPI002441F262|nr:class A beta-lactamase-related serine hydrolase [Streptomyces sp. DH37]MDG9705709.1 class A beta-lactamase-related serine hydrolase [Streptomyces sp. DH37]
MRLHARCVDCDRQTGVRPDEPVVLASVVKVPLVLEFARQAAYGQLDPAERVLVRRTDRLGGTGTAGCRDDVEMSLRDLAAFALSVSDNTAADVLFRRVGADTVGLLVRELGLEGTRIAGSPRDLLESVLADVGAADPAEFAAVYPTLSPERIRALPTMDPRRTNSGTARDMTRLLALIWTGRAGPPQACAEVRELMARQVSWHRLAAAFPEEVAVAAKSGTLPGIRNEIGVVSLPEGGRYAVAVLAETEGLGQRRPDLDAAIGAAGRAAVEELHGCCGQPPSGRRTA